MKVVRLATCADDFGMHAAIDDAVVALIAARRLSAVSCLVEGAQWATHAALLAAADADVGLHVNFTEALAHAQNVGPLTGVIARSYLRLLDVRRVRASIERQWDLFEAALGRAPDFVDGHQHVHQLPVVRDQLLAVIRSRTSNVRPWIRYTGVSSGGQPVDSKARVIAGLGSRRLKVLAQRAGCGTNRSLLGVYGFEADAAAYQTRLSAWLSQAQDGDLLMCHPATARVPDDGIAAARVCEFQVLTGDAWAGELSRHGVQIVRMSRILASANA